MGNPLFATKSVDRLRSDAEYGYGLKRSLTAFDLVLLGVGGIIAVVNVVLRLVTKAPLTTEKK